MPGKIAMDAELLGQVKQRIRQGQTRAALSANAEMILTYRYRLARDLHKVGALDNRIAIRCRNAVSVLFPECTAMPDGIWL
jgi:hypothetical protein